MNVNGNGWRGWLIGILCSIIAFLSSILVVVLGGIFNDAIKDHKDIIARLQKIEQTVARLNSGRTQ